MPDGFEREIRDKMEHLTQYLVSGQAMDYPSYREVVGKLSALRDVAEAYKEQRRKALDEDEDDTGANLSQAVRRSASHRPLTGY